MPNKHNTDHRHHIPKMFFKVQNWPEYEAALRRRGSWTFWIEENALSQWQSIGPRHCCTDAGRYCYGGEIIESSVTQRNQ